MGVGAFAEPLVVVTLLFGGVYVNRNTNYKLFGKNGRSSWEEKRFQHDRDENSGDEEWSSSPRSSADTLLEEGVHLSPSEPTWRKREISLWRLRFEVTSPNTAVFQDNFLSRLLRKLPFLAECWYWALIYWVRFSSDVQRVQADNVRRSIKSEERSAHSPSTKRQLMWLDTTLCR
jgi:hypothetical protein